MDYFGRRAMARRAGRRAGDEEETGGSWGEGGRDLNRTWWRGD